MSKSNRPKTGQRPEENVRIIRVFVSSPGDVREERELLDEVVRRINDIDGQERSLRLETWKWEQNSVPTIGPPPQAGIDAQTPDYDIYLGIMWTRFGTPTEGYGSGTEQEFEDALAKWKQLGRPWMLFYFNEASPPKLSPDQREQWAMVGKFQERLQKLGIVGTYTGPRGAVDGFFETVEQHLRKILAHYAAAKAGRKSPIVTAQVARMWLHIVGPASIDSTRVSRMVACAVRGCRAGRVAFQTRSRAAVE